MGGSDWGGAFFLLFLAAVILTPIILRNRLHAKQLDALTAALQHGVEPERIRELLPQRKDDDDVNGNWTAGQILLVLGWTYLPFGVLGLLAALSKAEADIGAVFILLPGVICLALGLRLLRIHKTIIGEVVKRANSAPPASGAEPGAKQ
jgi:hypothetical protein